MYRDAKEELKRLEDALLEEEPQQEEEDSQWNIDDEALSDIPDLPAPDRRDRLIFWLTVTIIVLTAGIVAMVAFWLIRYGGAFL
ncbi:MAG: hypothetical protein IJA47_05270 [Oscillospiraceae bacterium]|nr:hypothetical protein [Oscillospiraceae bacterium]